MSDAEAGKLVRADEAYVHAIGGSHLHTVDRPDPVIDAPTFAEAVVAAEAFLAAQDAEVEKIQAQVPDILKLLAAGRSLSDVAIWLGTTEAIVKKAIA